MKMISVIFKKLKGTPMIAVKIMINSNPRQFQNTILLMCYILANRRRIRSRKRTPMLLGLLRYGR
jgi:hypothetical protein